MNAENRIQNRNQTIKTTIIFNDIEVIVELKAPKNANYIERTIFLDEDNASYELCYCYGPVTYIGEDIIHYAKVVRPPVRQSSKVWLKYYTLFNRILAEMNELDLHEHILEVLDETDAEVDDDVLDQIHKYIEDHPLENEDNLDVYTDEIIKRFL